MSARRCESLKNPCIVTTAATLTIAAVATATATLTKAMLVKAATVSGATAARETEDTARAVARILEAVEKTATRASTAE
jgi:hypothetical protein